MRFFISLRVAFNQGFLIFSDNFGESGSEVSHFIPEPRNFAEVTKLSENIRKPWLKATFKEKRISSITKLS